VQLIVALVVALVLVAVPLYWFRGPSAEGTDSPASSLDIAAASIARPPPDPTKTLLAAALDGGVKTDKISLGRVWIDSCRQGGTRKTKDQCDRQPFFEEALVKAILDNPSCAPKTSKESSISYALRVDYQAKTSRVFAGKSGTVEGKQAQPSIECVQRAMPRPSWETLSHAHTKYTIAVLATYPAAGNTQP